MTRALVAGLGLAAVYLLVLTSVAPGDVAIAVLLGVATTIAVKPRGGTGAGPLRIGPWGWWTIVRDTTAEIARGSWRVARFCLTGHGAPGLVEVPREDRSDVEVALWGVLTGEAPDEIVVDVDEERDVLIVHVVDARDPDAVRARHRLALERWRRGRAADHA